MAVIEIIFSVTNLYDDIWFVREQRQPDIAQVAAVCYRRDLKLQPIRAHQPMSDLLMLAMLAAAFAAAIAYIWACLDMIHPPDAAPDDVP
jgi:hypothetical protein